MNEIEKTGSTGHFWKECGEGDPVLLLHGNPGSHEDLMPLARKVAEAGFRAVVPDRPGHGRSPGAPSLTGGPLVGILREACGGSAFVFGHSIGAWCALRLALESPGGVRGLLLSSPFVFPASGEKPSGLPALAEKPLIGGLLRALLPTLAKGKVSAHAARTIEPDPVDPAQLAQLVARGSTSKELLAVMTDKNDFLNRPLSPSALSRVNAPTLLVLAGADRVADPIVHSQQLARALKGVEKVTLENAPHDLPLRRPGPLADLVVKFLKEKAGGTEDVRC